MVRCISYLSSARSYPAAGEMEIPARIAAMKQLAGDGTYNRNNNIFLQLD